MESDQLKLLARGVQPIDNVVSDVGSMGLKVYVDVAEAIPAVASVLSRAEARSRGPVTFCLLDPTLPGEVEISLEQDFPVNMQIKSAVKSLTGVVMVEEI